MNTGSIRADAVALWEALPSGGTAQVNCPTGCSISIEPGATGVFWPPNIEALRDNTYGQAVLDTEQPVVAIVNDVNPNGGLDMATYGSRPGLRQTVEAAIAAIFEVPTLPLGRFRPHPIDGHMGFIDESWYEKPEGIREHDAAGGVVCRMDGKRVLVAFALESDHPEPVLPKGHVEEGETIEEAARREVEEETGLSDLTLLRELGVRERLTFSRQEWKRTHYFLYATKQSDARPSQWWRHSGVIWQPLDPVPNVFWPEQAQLLADLRDEIDRAMREWAEQIRPAE